MDDMRLFLPILMTPQQKQSKTLSTSHSHSPTQRMLCDGGRCGGGEAGG